MDGEIEPIRAQSLKEACVERLEHMILSGELAIGERLPSERDFAARLSVSRPVLHQALVELEARGLVQIIPRRGTFISDYRRDGSLALLASLLSYHNGALSGELMESMIDMRQLLETETARLAAHNRTDAQLAALGELHEAERAAAGEGAQALTELDFRFHHAVAMASGNRVYPLILNSFKEVYTSLTGEFFRRTFGTPIVSEVHQFHAQLVAAFGRRDGEAAAQAMAAMLSHGAAYLKGGGL